MKELSLKQNLLWNTIGCLIYQGCQWLTTIFVVLLSSSYENSGILAFAMATGNVYTGLATYNVRTFQISDINSQFSSRNYIGFRFVTVILASIACLAYSFAVAPSTSTAIAISAYLLFKADESFVNVLYGIDQKAQRMDYIGISQGIRGILSISSFCSALILLDNLTAAFLAMFACCVIITLFFDIPKSRKVDSVGFDLPIRVCKELFRLCAPSVIAILSYGLVATIARQWFGLQYGEEALGIYSAVATPCVLVQVMANYLYSPFLVPIARSWVSHNTGEFTAQLKKLLLGMAAVIVICLLFAYIAGVPLVDFIYGESIQDYSWMITPAMVAASFMAADCLLTDLLIVMRKYLYASLINIASLGSCVALMTPFMSLWYMNGINLVISASFAIGIAVGLICLAKSRKLKKTI